MSYVMALVALLGILSLFYFVNRRTNKLYYKNNFLSQSERHEIIQPFISKKTTYKKEDEEFDIEDEIEEFLEENAVNVVMEGDMIYWVQDNVFYTARVIDEEVDQDSIHPIDTDSMSKSELEKMLFILDALKE